MDSNTFQGMVPIYAAVETDEIFFLVQPYLQYTLSDIVTFSPAILESSHAKPLFVVYQLLQAMQSLHDHGLRLGNTPIAALLMDKNMWMRICGPRVSTFKPYPTDLLSPLGSERTSLLKSSSSLASVDLRTPLSFLNLQVSVWNLIFYSIVYIICLYNVDHDDDIIL